ncbi:MAG: hypothetical protein V9E83_03645 [Baekduia sp.]
MITGYWPPTNWMVSRFSTSSELNPDGWIGGNWEGRGYDVYSYFPTFNPDDAPNWGKGTGDFEVDYQDTSADWQRIVNRDQAGGDHHLLARERGRELGGRVTTEDACPQRVVP